MLHTVEQIAIRPMRADDVVLVEQMSADLSVQSLYYRFFAGVPVLPQGFLRQLRNLDHDQHEAVIAVCGGLAIGIAEFVRSADPSRAELAVIVADSWHRKGVARRLIGQLTPLACRAGVTDFEASVLPENHAVRNMLTSMFPAGRYGWRDGMLAYELPLRQDPASEPRHQARRPRWWRIAAHQVAAHYRERKVEQRERDLVGAASGLGRQVTRELNNPAVQCGVVRRQRFSSIRRPRLG